MRILSILIAAFVFIPRISFSQVTAEARIRVAAISYVLNFLRPHEAGPVVACVSVSSVKPSQGYMPMHAEADLDSTLIAAIPPTRLPVRPGNACYVARVSLLPRLEKGTDRPGVMIVAGAPEFKSEDRAAILVQYSIHGRNGLGFVCKVTRAQSAWHIEACEETWIS